MPFGQAVEIPDDRPDLSTGLSISTVSTIFCRVGPCAEAGAATKAIKAAARAKTFIRPSFHCAGSRAGSGEDIAGKFSGGPYGGGGWACPKVELCKI